MAPGGSFFASWPRWLEAGRGRGPPEAFPPLPVTQRTAKGEDREEQEGSGGSPGKLDGALPPGLYPTPSRGTCTSGSTKTNLVVSARAL